MIKLTVVTALALLLAGCANPPTGLVGTWADDPLGLTFHEDGTLSSTFSPRPGQPLPDGTGTWTLAGDLLRIELDEQGGNPVRLIHSESASTYYVGADHLAFGALWPVGAHHGLVGTWKGRDTVAVQSPPDPLVDTMLELSSDHGCSRTTSNRGVESCTWSQDASGGVILDIDPRMAPLQLVDDQVLSNQVLMRIP